MLRENKASNLKFNLNAMVILVFLVLAPTRSASTSTGIETKVPNEKVVKRIRKAPPNQISYQSLNSPQNRSLSLSQEFNLHSLHSQKVDYDVLNTLKKLSTLYVKHDPISISSTANFSATAAIENWPGNGSKSNPYTINGLNITGPADRILIGITNTDAYFQISNCVLSDGLTGIYFYNVLNGVISNNTISHCSDYGIFLLESKSSRISNNSVVNNSKTGIYLDTSTYNRISDNFVSENQRGSWGKGDPPAGFGILITNSNYSIIFNNTVSNNENGGIFSAESSHSNLSSNVVFNNSGHGIDLEESENCILSNNIISYNFEGIFFWNSGNNTISGNHISNHMDAGIYLSVSGNNRIIDNVFLNNGLDVESWEDEQNFQAEVENNTINGKELIFWQNVIGGTIPNGGGQIILVNCTAVTIANQSLSNVTTGIRVISSRDLLIQNNIVFNNSWYGIFLRFSQNCTILRNDLFNNGVGLFIEMSVDCNVSDNVINDSTAGIGIWGSESINLSDNTLTNNHGTGISFSDSENSSVSNNTVVYNGGSGISLGSSENSIIFSNNISDCYRGIEIGSSDDCNLINNVVANTDSNGVSLWDSRNSNVSNNTIHNCLNGIFLMVCEDSSVVNNTVFENIYVGIRLENSNQNNITDNLAYNNSEHGIWLYESDRNILLGNVGNNNTFCGIKLVQSSAHNWLENNIVFNNNEDGFWIVSSTGNTVINNTSNYNYFYGISLTSSDANTIANNFFMNNVHHGIAIDQFSENNVIKWNDFIENNPVDYSQAYDIGSDNIFSFNYWNDWTSPDVNTNGIVDIPYSIGGEMYFADSYPLVFSNLPPIELVGLKIAFPNGGETLNRTIPIRWKPAIDARGDSFVYSFYYSSDGGITWVLFVQTQEIPTDEYDVEFQFDWNTTDMTDGSNYLIKVIAENFESSRIEDTSDNTFTIQNHPPPLPPPPLGIRVALFFLIVGVLAVVIRSTLNQRK